MIATSVKRIAIGGGVMLACLITLFSCSTQKNTRVSRFYHNLNAHYNVYFNANVAYNESEKIFDKSVRLNYESCLPVFLMGSKDSIPEAEPLLKRAVEKSYMTIQKHSITVKPKPKKGKMTTGDKLFYSRNEFCDYIDDAYLTIGRSQAYRLDFENSKLAFEYIVANYPQETSKWEAQLWLALLAIKSDNLAQASFIFQKQDGQKGLPKQSFFLNNAVRTEWAVAQKDYPQALGFLEKALRDFHGTRAQELRMRYLRAQLLEKTGEKKSAYGAYEKLLRAADLSYEMQFNARLAMAYLSEGVGIDKLKKLLMQMADEPRNKAYVDRIWTVLGKIEWQAGNHDQAMAYYENALNEVNVTNESKLKIYQELLNGYFKTKNYIMAYPVLKNMLALMGPAHPRYSVTEGLYTKYKNLGENLEIIQRSDSLLRMSQQTEEQKTVWAKEQVEHYLKEKFEQERRAALRTESKIEKAQEGQFYFYNKKVLEQGKLEFEKKWGGRRMEDNWRRADQRLSSYSDAGSAKMKMTSQTDTAKSKQKQLLPNQPEYYLQMLPQTEVAVKSMKSNLAQAYYLAGKAYVEELKEAAPGVKLWEKCLKYLPQEPASEWVAFDLAKYYRDLPNAEKVDQMKAFLTAQFPQSLSTQQLCNPAFVAEMTQKYQKRQALLDTVSQWYLAEQYARVIAQAPQILQELSGGDEARKVELMLAISTGTQSQEAYKAALSNLGKKYRGTEEANYALQLLATLEPPAVKPKVEPKVKEATFTAANSPYYFVVFVHEAAKINQLKFNINVLNANRFRDVPMPNVFDRTLKDGKKIVCCGTFATLDLAKQYLQWVRSSSTNILDKVGADDAEFALISTSNLKVLEQSGNSASYIQYYRANIQ